MVRVSRWLIPTVVALALLTASAGTVHAQVVCYYHPPPWRRTTHPRRWSVYYAPRRSPSPITHPASRSSRPTTPRPRLPRRTTPRLPLSRRTMPRRRRDDVSLRSAWPSPRRQQLLRGSGPSRPATATTIRNPQRSMLFDLAACASLVGAQAAFFRLGANGIGSLQSGPP